MSNALIIALRQSDINKLIVQKMHDHKGKLGQLSKDGVTPDDLPADMIHGLNETLEEFMLALKEMHTTLLANKVAVESAEAYVAFMCDFIPAYFALSTHDEILTMKKEEIEAIVIAQCANTSLHEKRRQLAEHAFNTMDGMTIEQITSQYKDVEDGHIEEAYKTLLHTQINAESQPK